MTAPEAPANDEESKTPSAAGKHSDATPRMSEDEEAIWTKAAGDLTMPNVLSRIQAHDKSIISTVATVGTLLTGLGGAAAAVAITRNTFYWHSVPLVPVGAIATSVLAAASVVVALVGRRPRFARVNTNNLFMVREWYEEEVGRGKWVTRIASWLSIVAAVAAAVTSAVAGGVSVFGTDTKPQNQAVLLATYGEKGAVSLQLSGAVVGVGRDQHVVIAISSNGPAAFVNSPVISGDQYPDENGKVSLESKATAPVASSMASARIWILDKDKTNKSMNASPSYMLTIEYPKVPEPAASADGM